MVVNKAGGGGPELRAENSGCVVYLERNSGHEASQMEKQVSHAQALLGFQELTSGSLGKHRLPLSTKLLSKREVGAVDQRLHVFTLNWELRGDQEVTTSI